ncbi:MAG: hypothetical protein HW386_690 [Gammaproteobacteria bacterium]|nr:hypothetical protein [Gammaproteobacteria bacterium]
MNPHGINADPQHAVISLPPPDAAALAHSARLIDRIRAELDGRSGYIGFDRYMELALYEPGLGYYSAGARKFGQDGDFVTAPELSPLFSICLARQCRQILTGLPDGSILELGAGTGKMACDILLELQRCNALPARYLILETSADLKQRQQQLLQAEIPDYFTRIIWLERLPEQPLSGVILANEVMDALPVHRIVDRQGVLYELQVQWHGGDFAWLEVPAGPALSRQVQDIKRQLRYSWPEVYTTEINMTLAPWLAALSESLTQGVMLLIDYGYPRNEFYHPERTDGTLLCHYRHRVHADPFLYPGLQDITASVDFTAVATAAVKAGLDVTGYTNQMYFLLGCGLDTILADMGASGLRQQLELANQAKMLTLPGGMGERFKVIALSRGMAGGLAGFAIMDQRKHL